MYNIDALPDIFECVVLTMDDIDRKDTCLISKYYDKKYKYDVQEIIRDIPRLITKRPYRHIVVNSTYTIADYYHPSRTNLGYVQSHVHTVDLSVENTVQISHPRKHNQSMDQRIYNINAYLYWIRIQKIKQESNVWEYDCLIAILSTLKLTPNLAKLCDHVDINSLMYASRHMRLTLKKSMWPESNNSVIVNN